MDRITVAIPCKGIVWWIVSTLPSITAIAASTFDSVPDLCSSSMETVTSRSRSSLLRG